MQLDCTTIQPLILITCFLLCKVERLCNETRQDLSLTISGNLRLYLFLTRPCGPAWTKFGQRARVCGPPGRAGFRYIYGFGLSLTRAKGRRGRDSSDATRSQRLRGTRPRRHTGLCPQPTGPSPREDNAQMTGKKQ